MGLTHQRIIESIVHSIGMVHSYINSDSGSQGSAIYYLSSAPFAARAADGRPQFTDPDL